MTNQESPHQHQTIGTGQIFVGTDLDSNTAVDTNQSVPIGMVPTWSVPTTPTDRQAHWSAHRLADQIACRLEHGGRYRPHAKSHRKLVRTSWSSLRKDPANSNNQLIV
jgi:hypothetical protein